jgi:hypothetical protein
MTINFNTEPYYDDFSEDNKFYRILYRPGYAVQARELTQMQTILQNQISRFGDHVFKEGAMVIPGQSSLDTDIDYIKLTNLTSGVITDNIIENFVGLTVQNASGLQADVIFFSKSEGADPPTLFVRYKNSGDNNTSKQFSDNDIIQDVDGTFSVQAIPNVTPGTAASTGKGSIATITRGVYYLKGHFVLVEDQTIILDKFNNKPSYRIGLLASEKIITSEEDTTLFDNAQNSFNFAAPGAHRYYIEATLIKLDANSANDEDFIELIRTGDGQVKREVRRTEYSVLEDTFARRTYDESGNYTVRNFEIDVREYRNNNRGQWTAGRVYLIGDVVTNAGNTYVAQNSGTSSSAVPPTHTSGIAFDGSGTGVQWEYNQFPFYNRGIYSPGESENRVTQEANEAKLAVGLEPGKAYVQGYEIEKVSTEYVPVQKSRDFVQVQKAFIPATVGNYLLVTNVNNLPPVHDFAEIDLYDRITEQGTVTLTGNITTSLSSTALTAVGGAFTTQLIAGSKIYNPAGTFVGTVETITDNNTATLTANAAVALAGITGVRKDGRGTAVGNKVGTARARLIEWHNGTVGSQTAQYKLSLFDIKLNSGIDFARKVKSLYYNVNNDTNLSFSADIQPITTRLIGSATASSSTTITGTGTSFQTDFIVGDYVSFGGALRRVVSIASQVSMTVDSAITITGSTLDRVSTTIFQPESSSLLFQLPYYAIKDVRDPLLSNSVVYNVYERFVGTASVSPEEPLLTVSTASGSMTSADDSDNYIVMSNDSDIGGTVINVAESDISVSGSSVTFKLPASLSGKEMVVIAAVQKSGAALTEKTKTLVFASKLELTTANAAQKTELLLGKADGYRLVSVKMKSGTFAVPGPTYSIDITDRYEFDTGQRTTHYDVARLVLKNSFAPPSAPIEITFDYFTHSPGDYFTVNSYPTNFDYKSIPLFQGISLRDTLDFRPRINDAGTLFTGAGSSPSLVPKRGVDIQADFKYHLARKTKIAVDFGGNFFAIDGVASLNPGEPLDPALGLVLYTLNLEPYTFGTQSNNVQINRVDNKRYTMRDIGKLEKRIDNLEYYTALSLLEQQTESLDVIDSNGDTRFKNGFIVDGFAGHNTGDTTSPDYVCSIDMEKAELRPFYSMQNINMIEKRSNNTDRASSNYKLYGDVITLPVIEDVALISQPYASRLENINPFAVFTFLGDVKLNPSSDDWFEVDRRPDLVVNVEGNFNTIKNLAERSGVLGTVWNAWQTQWFGVPVIQNNMFTGRFSAAWGANLNAGQQIGIDDINRRFGNVQGAGWARREVTVQTSAVQVGQSRTGVKTSLVTKIDRQVVGDRVLSTAAIPYIRSRNVLVQVRGLKPLTRFYPYFDDISVSSFCTRSSRIAYTPAGATDAARLQTHNRFDDTTNVGGLANGVARRIDGDSQVCLNRGDVITGANSGATAVVVGKEYNPDTLTYALYVVNIRGVFQANETITGSVSNATGTAGTITTSSRGGDLVTNFNGDLQLLFNIPNTEELRFRTGTRELKLIDNSVANGDFTSRGRANYRAEGVLETRQQTVHAVRNAELVEEQLVDNRVITQTAERVVADTGWYDPLAQTFLIEQRGGAFLSKVDIFFATKDSSIPVTLEIREVVNGYPGKRVLPFSKVTLKPEEVSLSTTIVNLNGVATNSYDTPTTFRFPSPVYVQENTEYAIVLASDSNNYKVWISQVGEQMPGTARTISEQPYLGSLFKSQNASTWTADQMQDLKFTLYRARFQTGVVGNVEYVNDAMPLQRLDTDPFETRAGSNKIRVWHRDHGMPANSLVIISGVDSPVNGIPAAQLNNPANDAHTISDVDLDSYTITVATNATASGYGGGSQVRATRNLQYDVVQPMVQIQRFSDTPIDFGIKTITGKSVDSVSQQAYIADNSFSGVLANENNNFSSPRMIASEVNEEERNVKSITMNVTMSTTNDALSPILDTHRTSIAVISNKVNNPSEVNMNVAILDDNVILSNATGVTISGNTLTTSTQNLSFLTATVGKYLTVSGASTGSSTRLITGVAEDGSSITLISAPAAVTGNITLTQRERFVDEIAPLESSTFSKYVTKTVNLANASNFLRVRFAANIPSEARVEVYYKTAIVGSNSSFDSVPYRLMNSDSPIINASNATDQFYDVSYSANDLSAFDKVKLKLVFKSQNTSEVPRIKDLRIIACA